MLLLMRHEGGLSFFFMASTVYVGGIPRGTEPEALALAFAPLGIAHVAMCRGFAFVTLSSADDAAEAKAAFFFWGRGSLDTQATPATSEATVHPDPGHSPHLSGGRAGRTRSATPPSGPRPSRHAPAPPVGQPDPATPSGASPPEPTPGGRT